MKSCIFLLESHARIYIYIASSLLNKHNFVSCKVVEQEIYNNEDPQAVLKEYLSSGDFSSNMEVLDSSDPLVSTAALCLLN